MPSSREQFFPFLERKFPKLARQYREWYQRASDAPESYRREISQRVAALRTKYGLAALPPARTAVGVSGASPQLDFI